MNKLKITIMLSCLLSIGCLISGCSDYVIDKDGKKVFNKDSSNWGYVVYDGHEYVMWNGASAGGITHSPKCPCHKIVK